MNVGFPIVAILEAADPSQIFGHTGMKVFQNSAQAANYPGTCETTLYLAVTVYLTCGHLRMRFVDGRISMFSEYYDHH